MGTKTKEKVHTIQDTLQALRDSLNLGFSENGHSGTRGLKIKVKAIHMSAGRYMSGKVGIVNIAETIRRLQGIASKQITKEKDVGQKLFVNWFKKDVTNDAKSVNPHNMTFHDICVESGGKYFSMTELFEEQLNVPCRGILQDLSRIVEYYRDTCKWNSKTIV